MISKDLVYKLVQQIPISKVATYGQIARLAGNPKCARVVGYYMKINSNAPNIPCHRVVSSNGNLTGYSLGDGITTKRQMLIDEGVVFKGNKVDLSVSIWDK